MLQAALVNLLARNKPDRVIIEPSGLGHPAGLLDLLRGEAFQDVVAVHDIIATLDPRRLDESRVREHETFQDQLAMADAIAITMGEQASTEQHEHAQRFVTELWPPRKWVHRSEHGTMPLSLLLNSAQTRAQQDTAVPDTHRQMMATPTLEGAFLIRLLRWANLSTRRLAPLDTPAQAFVGTPVNALILIVWPPT